jgi:hypothetical protein
MSDIFIGYAVSDRARATALAGSLEAHGWSIWWDRKIPAGKAFDEVIEDALREAKAVVILWSRRGAASSYLRAEAQYAIDDRKYVPITIEDVELPLSFRRYQSIDMSAWDEGRSDAAFLALGERLEELIGSPRQISVEPSEGVFISHSAEDRDFTETCILPPLKSHSLSTWYAGTSIQPGEDWERSVLAGMKSCRWFLVVLSPDAVRSEWVSDEIHWAFLKRRGQIIPVMYRTCDVCDLHLSLAPLHYVDFRHDLEGAQKRLLTFWEIEI